MHSNGENCGVFPYKLNTRSKSMVLIIGTQNFWCFPPATPSFWSNSWGPSPVGDLKQPWHPFSEAERAGACNVVSLLPKVGRFLWVEGHTSIVNFPMFAFESLPLSFACCCPPDTYPSLTTLLSRKALYKRPVLRLLALTVDLRSRKTCDIYQIEITTQMGIIFGLMWSV